MKRNTYIDNIAVEEAKIKYYKKLNIKFECEEIDVVDSVDRVTYEPIYAKYSSPNYNAAAMDGIAVKSGDTIEATEISPIVLEENKDFLYINTGNIIKEPYDSVIMIEDVIELKDCKVKILKSAYPWQHIRQIGEDIVATEMIIPSKHKIRPLDLGALLSGGIEKIKVYKKPKVGIIPTGTEIIENITDLKEGKIIDSNSRVFKSEIEKLGAIPNRYSPVKDDYNLLKKAVLKGIEENDILLINAGSSAGSKDYTVNLIEELGQLIVHGIAMKPGKPTILGIINKKPVIGIPGYPVSSYLVFDKFVKPLIKYFFGEYEVKRDIISAKISKRIVSSFKNEELVRVTLGFVGDKLIATPLSSNAGATMSLVKADGVAIIPRNIEGVEAGDEIEVELYKPLNRIENTMVSIGSHDLIMDILGDMIRLTSGHVGSMGGILSIKRGECHISPIHLLDENTGEYNISYVKKYFKDEKMALIKGVKREQGFIVQKGNPKNIKDFNDLKRKDISYINRQRGAGTRVLFDYNLKLNNIKPEDIKGYKRELNTHMAVATGIKTGGADVGIGIYSAAKALELDFIKVTDEDYDFLVREKDLENVIIKKFIDTLKSEEFKQRVENLGGYSLENSGELVMID
ncbi:molybdopterin biosynthesis protein [Senegalia massiliensis]|uniref:molybdopterin biosynthesis protein n=1 Tax=Senegalia massiliensis TaxID=1720316 RepID=UPI0010324EE8|nr:molybdopterin biosynthesis protein [Senegalia massiliensis]